MALTLRNGRLAIDPKTLQIGNSIETALCYTGCQPDESHRLFIATADNKPAYILIVLW